MSIPTLILVLAVITGLLVVFAALLTMVVRRAALRTGFVDRPGGHKSHKLPVPYGGGIAIVLASWLALLALVLLANIVPESWVVSRLGEGMLPYLGGARGETWRLSMILLGGLALHLLGLWDDRDPIPAVFKLAVITLVAVFVAKHGQVRVVEYLGENLSSFLTVLWFIVIINAFNFLDNMDGLSAGIACICLFFFAVCGLLAGQVLVPALACVFLGAIGGFLIFNFPPAKIFMGDAGSLVVGYAIAVISVLTTYYHGDWDVEPFALATPFVILAIPLYDFLSVITIRVREGRNPMQGDQRHFSHRLVDHGLRRPYAVLTIYLATATTGTAATLLPNAGLRTTLTVALLVLMVLAIIAILETPVRKSS